MAYNFAGKVAVVTEGAGAIGAAVVQLLTERGAQVGLLDVPTSRDAQTTAELNGSDRKVLFIPTDVKEEQIFDLYRDRGFTLIRLKTCGGGLGCNEYVFVRQEHR